MAVFRHNKSPWKSEAYPVLVVVLAVVFWWSANLPSLLQFPFLQQCFKFILGRV